MQSWMPLIFIVMAVALAVGPIMMMRPTKSQQKLSNLRTQALNSGIRVSVTVWPERFKLSTNRLMRYNLPWQVQKPPLAPVLLIKRNFEHKLHLLDIWDWADGGGTGANAFEQLMLDCPILEDVSAVGCSPAGVFVDWNERKSADLAEIQAFLEAIRKALIDTL